MTCARPCIAFLVVALVLTGCGESPPASTPTGPTPPDTPGVTPEGNDPVPLSLDELAARLEARRAEADALMKDLAPEEGWRDRVVAALASAGFTDLHAPRRARMPGGLLDTLESRAARSDAPRVSVERWVGAVPSEAWERRMAAWLTPSRHALTHVEAVPVGDMTAWRSNLDDDRLTTHAWRRGNVFVRVVSNERGHASRIHETLRQAGAYGDVAAGQVKEAPEPGLQGLPPSRTHDDAEVEPSAGSESDKGSPKLQDGFPLLFEPMEEAIAMGLPTVDPVTGVPVLPEDERMPTAFLFGRRMLDDGSVGDRDDASMRAMERALRWLASHQSPGGEWKAAEFAAWCDGEPQQPPHGTVGAGESLYTVGVSALALQAFFAAGYTYRGEHPYAYTLLRGLPYLLKQQGADGFIGPRVGQQGVYNHAAATIALIHAYGAGGDPVYLQAATRALAWIRKARNPYFAWRYGIQPGDNDTSVTGWMSAALLAARVVNRELTWRDMDAAFADPLSDGAGVRAWLDRITDPDVGRAGYFTRGTGPARAQDRLDAFPADRSEAMTAAAVLARFYLETDADNERMKQLGIGLVAKLPPVWKPEDGSIDMYYWYYGTLAMLHANTRHRAAWNQALRRAVVPRQRTDGGFCGYAGSWDPIGSWGKEGGRVYSTALMAIALAVSNHHAPR